MNCYLPWNILETYWTREHCFFVLRNNFFPQDPSLPVYMLAFALTLTSEALVALPLLRSPVRKRIATVTLANLLTHPAVVFLWIPFAAYKLHWAIRESIFYAELVIPIIEAGVYHRMGAGSWRRVLAASFLANFISWTFIAFVKL